MPQTHRSIPIVDQSSIGEARRAAVQLALALGFSEERRSDIGIATTELATNVLVHARGGEIVACPFVYANDAAWLDVLALDSGGGIQDIVRAMEDGYSTAGTAGQGIGAISRLADESSLYSAPGKGTVFWSRFRSGLRESVDSNVGVLSVPIKGETKCGDGFYILPGASRSLYMMVDGLGHGAGANEAALEAIATVKRYSGESASTILHHSHEALKKTRGAAMSLAIVDHERLICMYAGVGNISASLVSGSLSRSLVSQNGTLGAVMPRSVQEYTYPIEEGTRLLMYSDGLTSRVDTSGYSGAQHRHPMLVAGLLYRDYTRRRDDATVLVAPLGTAL